MYWSLIDQYLHIFVFKKIKSLHTLKGLNTCTLKRFRFVKSANILVPARSRLRKCVKNKHKINHPKSIPRCINHWLYGNASNLTKKKINISIYFETSIDNLNTWCYTINVLNGLLDVKCKTSWDWFLKVFFSECFIESKLNLVQN